MNNSVRIFREKLGLTQSELANATGITRQTIYLIESGQYNPTLRLCQKICEVLKTDLNSLFS
jgi:putative transcriptional regulator